MQLMTPHEDLYDRIRGIIKSVVPIPYEAPEYFSKFKHTPTYTSIWQLVFYGYETDEAVFTTPPNKPRVMELEYDDLTETYRFEFRVLHYVQDSYLEADAIADDVMGVTLQLIEGFDAGGSMRDKVDNVDLEFVELYAIAMMSPDQAVNIVMSGDPLLSMREAIKRAKKYTKARLPANSWYSIIREWRKYHKGLIRSSVNSVVMQIYSTHRKFTLSLIVNYFRKHKYSVSPEIMALIRSAYIKVIGKEEKAILRVMKSIVRRNKPKSLRQLISIYRSLGYVGRTADLLPIARKALRR